MSGTAMAKAPEQSQRRAPIGPTRVAVLLLLIGMLVFALYLAFHEKSEHTGPAWVTQIPVNQSQPQTQLLPSPSSSPEVLAFNPGTVQGLPEKRPNVYTIEKSRPSTGATPLASASPHEYEMKLREMQERAGMSSNSDSEARRYSYEREAYRPSYRTDRYIGAVEERPRTITITSFPDVKDSKLTDALKNPAFEIKIKTTTPLKLSDRFVEAGEYTLKPKLEGMTWYLMFLRSNSEAGQIPLKLEASTVAKDELAVVFFELKKLAVIQIHLGMETMTGSVEKE